MNRFTTLLRREWLQHRSGWIAMVALPFALILLVGLFGQVHVDLGDGGGGPLQPLAVAATALVVVAGSTLAIAWGAALLMSPGLARRDVQDRSIEFWVSLPVPHAEAIGATLLAHLLLWPWVALGAGVAGGVLTAVAFVAKLFGFGALAALPWGALLAAALLLALRIALGLLLATLWLSPLILGTMAASAWLKRWGVPAVVAGLAFASLLLNTVYRNRMLPDALAFISRHASQALLAADRGGAQAFVINGSDGLDGVVGGAPGWLLHDAGTALAQAASPAFAAAVALGAAGFGLLWLRRRRGA